MEDMPQMPETTGFFQIFKESWSFDLIGPEWASGLSPAAIAAILLGCIVAAAAWYSYAYEENGFVRWFLDVRCRQEDFYWELVKTVLTGGLIISASGRSPAESAAIVLGCMVAIIGIAIGLVNYGY